MTSDTASAESLSPGIEQAVMIGDLAELNATQRAKYYTAVCRSLGLNPLTKPLCAVEAG
jgi:hypothetical protein